MLSDREARELESWLRSARAWAMSAQAMVRTATDLTNASRDLAVRLDQRPPSPLTASETDHGPGLAQQLRDLATRVEDDGRELRDRYLATEANLTLYASLLG
jgi:hypothetical protein